MTRTPSVTRTPSATVPPEPIITYFGLARADDTVVDPSGTTEDGIPIFERSVGSGFTIVVEGRRGGTNTPLERGTFLWDPTNPSILPGVQILASQPLGNASVGVCDDAAPTAGGVPGSESLNFDETQVVADTVNDLTCRFKDGSGQRLGRDAENACTSSGDGLFRVVGTGTEVQYCGQVNAAIVFPPGDTRLVGRVRDQAGNVSAIGQIVVRVAN